MFSTEDSLSAVYSDDSMNTVVYHLHAVLVHQGQASGGHYWSYIRKPPSLHVETPHAPGKPSSVADTHKSSQPSTSSEVAMNSPATSSADSGGGTEGAGGGKGEEGSSAKSRGWLKFNDVSVHEVEWEEVVKESYGGHHNTSAYCLIYLSPLLHRTWTGSGERVFAPLHTNIVLQSQFRNNE